MIDRFSVQWAFLSNFYASELVYEGVTYRTVEHAFQAAKTDDLAEKRLIAEAGTPSMAKTHGRRVKKLKPGWDQYWRYAVMEQLLAVKFAPETKLAFDLLITMPQALVEGNRWHDQIWGDCRCGRSECQPPGMNLLGWMLMRQRTFVDNSLYDNGSDSLSSMAQPFEV